MSEDVVDSLVGDESIFLAVARTAGLQTIFLGLDDIILAHVLLCPLIDHLEFVDTLYANWVMGVGCWVLGDGCLGEHVIQSTMQPSGNGCVPLVSSMM